MQQSFENPEKIFLKSHYLANILQSASIKIIYFSFTRKHFEMKSPFGQRISWSYWELSASLFAET